MTQSPSDGPDRPAVFVSYSHEDAGWLKDLLTMLSPVVQRGVLQVWSDGEIEPSCLWREEIDAAMAAAWVAVLLVSPAFLASPFIRDVELPHFLEEHRKGRVKILWALISPCLHEWTALNGIQALHDTKQPLAKLLEADRGQALKAICEAILKALGETPGGWSHSHCDRPYLDLDLGRLPIPGPLLVGREEELARLSAAWEDPSLHVLTFVAFGGVGKSALLLGRGELEAGAGLDGLAAAPEEARRFRQTCREVQERAGQTLEWVTKASIDLLSIALDHLSLGRAHLGLALAASVPATPGEAPEADFAQAAEHMDRAVEGLRQAGEEEFVSRGLLASAALHRLRG